jgi:hypothetical protein
MYGEGPSFEKLLPRSSSPSSEFAVEEKPSLRKDEHTRGSPIFAYILLALLGLSLIANVSLAIPFLTSISREHGIVVNQCRTYKPQTSLYCEHSATIPRLNAVNYEIVSDIITAPAQGALEFKLTKFASSIYEGVTEYQGPPTEYNNKLWKHLYSRTSDKVIKTQVTD